jgi:NADH-quinone oxidoreductase subunit C
LGLFFDRPPGVGAYFDAGRLVGLPQRKDVPLGYEEVAFSNNEAQIAARKPFAEE